MRAMTAKWRRFRVWAGQSHVWIPGSFIAMFAVIFLANGVMIWTALGTWRGLQTESPWDAGVTYNATLDAQAAQDALGWDVGVAVARVAADQARVRVRLRDAGGAPLAAERVRVGFVRPTQEGYDTTARLAPAGEGVFAGVVAVPLDGLWDVRISAERGADSVHVTRRITLTPDAQ